MTQELFGLQAHGVGLRLVQSVPQLELAGMQVPFGPQVSPQVTVFGQPFVASWAGINGPRGFSEGTYEVRLYEEGMASIKFPNGEGEDGVLHRRRLLITQSGRVTPLGGNVTTYEGGLFRPGDEFVEIYRASAAGAPGKLLFVLAVTKATIDSGSLTIEGNDALWLLKKTRESSAGIFVNGPRDVCEHFTKVKQVVIADDFPQDGTFNSGNVGSPDGRWGWQNAYNVTQAQDPNGAPTTWDPSLGSVVRLITYGTTRLAFLTTYANGAKVKGSFAMGQPDPWLRWEAKFRMAPGFSSTATIMIKIVSNNSGGGGVSGGWPGPGMTIYPSASGTGNVNPPGFVQLETAYSGSGGVGASLNTPGLTAQLPNFNPLAWHTGVIEMRDRYIFYYVDGRLIGILPQQGAVDNFMVAEQSLGTWYTLDQMQGFVGINETNLGVTAPNAADVDYAVFRTKQPGMLRPVSSANLGDYQVGGSPDAGSCLLEVWHWDDNPLFGMEFAPSRLSQFAGKFSARTLGFGGTSTQGAGVPDWWPSQQGVGTWNNAAWACRASGSMYLTLGTYDYRFRFNVDDGGRLWVGKTRFGEQLIDNWRTPVQVGHGSEIMSSAYAKNPSGYPSNSLAAVPGAGASSITLATGPGQSWQGQLIKIGTGPSAETAYVTTVSGTTVNLRDALVRASSRSIGDPVVILNQGSLNGLPTGWYPFIFEFFNNSGGAGGATVQYDRSDQPNWWNNVGAGAYLHTIYSMVQKYGPSGSYYWPLHDGLWEVGYANYYDYITGGAAVITSSDTAVGTTRNTLVPGDSALLLNGGVNAVGPRSGDSLSLGTGITINTSQWTISAVFRCDVVNGTYQNIFRKDNNTTAALLLRINAGNMLEVGIYSGSAWTFLNTGQGVSAGRWYHAVATWDGATIRLYLNGSLVNSVAYSGVQANPAVVSYIGSAFGSTEWFNGALGHVLLLPAAMSAVDVTTLYNAVTSPPHIPISESGIVDTTQQPLRYVSHYDQLVQTVKDWGLQITTEPMQLESGEFPGRLRPLLRVGRDTEYKVGSPQINRPTASDIQDAITAEEVCDALVADAQGLADPTGASQIAAEVFSFGDMFGLVPGSAFQQALHPWLSEEYDQSNDVSFPDLLVQRLYSMLALRGGPWEQISMSHRPERQLVDTFPLTGAPAEFSWLPGDGVRLDMPEYGIEDLSPRQVLGVQWPFTPSGLGAPSISLRQRPRNFRQVLRDMFRATLSSQRSYQGQLTSITSSYGSNNGANASDGSSVDTYARANLPNNLGNIVSATLNVQFLGASTTYNVNVNGQATGLQVTRPGRYDVTPWVGRSDGGAQQRFYVQLVVASGTGAAEYQVEILLRV